METEAKGQAAPGKTRKPSRWLPLAISTVAAGLIIGLTYYGLQYFRSSTVSDERAFRVLREMIGQFGNFQSAIAGLLTRVPSDSNSRTTATAEFLKSLSLEGQWVLKFGPCEESDLDKRTQLIIDTSTAARDFTMTRWCQSSDKGATLHARKIQLSESLARQLPTFLGQEFFDVVILSLADGTTLASFPRHHRSEPGTELYETGSENLMVASVGGLLQHAMRQQESEDLTRPKLARAAGEKPAGGEKPALPTPQHPVVLTDTIAGETYRVFIQPFEPDYAITLSPEEDLSRQTPLYLVGLKRPNVYKTLVDTLGSTGSLSITLIVLLAVLMWPLMSLKFSSPQEPISSTQVLAAGVALLLIPVVVAVTGFSVWAQHRLTAWVDQAAEVYARSIEHAALAELSSDAQTLDSLAAQFSRNLHDRVSFMNGDANVACLSSATFDSCKVRLTVPAVDEGLPTGWSALHSAAPLDLQGKSPD